jgi:hypothetical protein
MGRTEHALLGHQELNAVLQDPFHRETVQQRESSWFDIYHKYGPIRRLAYQASRPSSEMACSHNENGVFRKYLVLTERGVTHVHLAK